MRTLAQIIELQARAREQRKAARDIRRHAVVAPAPSHVEQLVIPAEITTLGGAIRWARRQRGLSVGVLADRVGMSLKTVQNIEYGTQRTTYVARFERELGVELFRLPQMKTPTTCTDREPLPPRTPRVAGRPDRDPRSFCPCCFGLSHRRPRVGRCECGERYAGEAIERVIPDCQSSAGLFEVA